MDTHQRRMRLWTLLARSPQGFTVRELAERFRVSKGTIARDLDRLSFGGAQLDEEPDGLAVRYFARGAPPAAGFTEAEKLALAAARGAFAPWAGTPLAVDLTSALAKAGAAGVEVDARGPVGKVRLVPEVVEAVGVGLRERRVCVIDYRARGERKARAMEVEPLRLVAVGGLLYLRAAVRPGRKVVTLALHLAEGARVWSERFVPVRERATGFGAVEGKPVRVVVRFDAVIAEFIEERVWHPTQRIMRERGSGVRFEARLSGMHEFVGWVMGWGERAEIVAPREWRREAARRVRGMVGVYGSSNRAGQPSRSDRGERNVEASHS